MNDYLEFAAAGWLMAIPLILAVWLSPRALTKIARRMVARADGLTAARAIYKLAYDTAMDENGDRMKPSTLSFEMKGFCR